MTDPVYPRHMSDIDARRLEEKERRRLEIIDAAETVFGEVGFDKATMLQIARKARLSRALVYIYFKDKSDLQFAIAERAGQQLTQRFSEAVARNKKGLDQIEAIGRAYLAFSQEFPVYFNAISMFEALVSNGSAAGANVDACMAGHQQKMAIMVGAIQLGIKDESIRADIGDPLITAITLWGFMHGIIQLSTSKADAFARDGINVQHLARHALAMARHSMKGPRA
jgi:AcrR family transcriptional regulator